jgi:hypothetical protein
MYTYTFIYGEAYVNVTWKIRPMCLCFYLMWFNFPIRPAVKLNVLIR